jgi:predicted Fe-Mo cluster-binding NifX family protein
MTIAIAATAPEVNSQIAMHGARAPFYLVFDKQGDLLGSMTNPCAQVDSGAAPQAAAFLAEHGVTVLAAGDFGSRFISELEVNGIVPVQKMGRVSDVIGELIAND